MCTDVCGWDGVRGFVRVGCSGGGGGDPVRGRLGGQKGLRILVPLEKLDSMLLLTVERQPRGVEVP